MDKIFIAIAFIAALGVVATLFGGLAAMSNGSDKARLLSQRLMRLRVLFQGIAIVALFLAYVTKP